MANTNLRGEQIADGSIRRVDLNTTIAGKAVIAKIVQGTGISISSTGTDSGTGDVTVNINTASASQIGGVKIGTGLSIDGSGVLSVGSLSYLPLAGGTVTGNTTFDANIYNPGNMIVNKGSLKIVKNPLSSYNASSSTGAIIIKLPKTGNTMFDMDLIYQDYTNTRSGKYRLTGYWYGAYFHATNSEVSLICDNSFDSNLYNIRYAHDVSGNPILIFGLNTTSFPGHLSLSIEELRLRYSGYSNTLWDDTANYSITYNVTDLSPYTVDVSPTTEVIMSKSGNITFDGKVGTTANIPLITGAGGIVQAGSFGTTANTFAQGNDSRILNGQTAFTSLSNYLPLVGGTLSGSLLYSNATISTIAGFDSSKNLVSLSTSVYPTLTELSYVKGVTSSIQSQLGNKQPLDADLTAIAGLTGTSGLLKKTAANTWTLDPTAYTANLGTVTSVGLSMPGIFSIANSPVTTSGTLTVTLANQNANIVFAGPSSGGAAVPTFRSLVAADIPTLNQNTTGSAAKLTTPRTINGVAFDGTANITIPSGPASALLDYHPYHSGSYDGADYMSINIPQPSSLNLFDITGDWKAGLYNYDTAVSDNPDPTNYAGGRILHIPNSNSSTFTQLGFPEYSSSGIMYVRSDDGSGITPWEEVLHSGNLVNYVGNGTAGYVSKWNGTGMGQTNSIIYDNGTNVGIGTTTPYGKFGILTGTVSTSNIASQLNGSVAFSNGGNGAAIPTISGKSDSNRGLMFVAASVDVKTSIPDMDLNVRLDTNADFTTLTSEAFRFSRYGTQLVSIMRDGRLGIGTTNPLAKLHVNGELRIDEGSWVSNINQAGIARITSQFTTVSEVKFYGHTGSASNQLLMNLTGQGNLILTRQFSQIIGGANNGRLLLSNESSSSYVELSGSTATTPHRASLVSTLGYVTIFTNNIERLRVLNNGNVGIGTTNPNYKLEVGGAVFVNAGNNEGFRLNGGSGILRQDSGLGFNTNSTEKMRITSGGNVLIGTTTDSGHKLRVNGVISSTNDMIAFAASDRRLKDNIKPILNPLDKISKLGGYEFDWNDKQTTYTGHDVGVIAQEVEAVLPELVTTRDNGYKAVKYEKLVALLIAGINELREEVKQLKAK